jgi:hypothetical protein
MLERFRKRRVRLPEQVLWLHDAPLFIDEAQVDALYDAILAPAYEETAKTISSSLTASSKVGTEANLGIALPGLLTGGTKVTGELSGSGTRGREVTLVPVSNAYRHLLALTLHYAVNWPKRIRIVSYAEDGSCSDRDARQQDTDAESAWLEPDFIRGLPRSLVLLELPPSTMLVPTALEVDGEVRTLYQELGAALARDGEDPPGHLSSKANAVERADYWQWFADRFDDTKAMQVVEAAIAGGAMSWIDYRVPLVEHEDRALHLHLQPRKKYETGVFAYNFIKRGFKHGIRVAGTLKSEPDMNVLALFER